jgi:pyruvate/2-oxoglutarate dehydrogenase complex dihydrolipoamide dehydrogenase (E3) component
MSAGRSRGSPRTTRGVRGPAGGVRPRPPPHDAAERFEHWGVEVLRARARFTGPRSLTAGGRVLRAPRIVLAVGSRPRIPGIPGLADVPLLTNDTVFGLDVLPRHLIVLGAGAVGVELAQAFRRLGAAVTLVDAGPALSREEPEAAALVTGRLLAEGVTLRTDVAVTRAGAAGREGGGTVITLTLSSGEAVTGSHLLVAAGREANLADLDLAAATSR